MKQTFLKIFFPVFLAAGLFFAFNCALALELNYPNIPGLGRLSDYQNLDQSQQLGFVLSYIFKLAFFVSLGAGFVALLSSGVLYIVSISKPRLLTLSKAMAGNAMLGLFILLCAYLLLYAVNPQLLSLTLNKPELKIAVDQTANPYDKNTIVIEQAPFTQEIRNAVNNLAEKVYLTAAGQYYEQINVKGDLKWCLTDGYARPVNASGELLKTTDSSGSMEQGGCVTTTRNSNDSYMYRAEIQAKETAQILGAINSIAKDKKDANGNVIQLGLEGLLAKCKCGDAISHTVWGLRDSRCEPGLDPAKDKQKILDYKKQGNYCAIQCRSCGKETDKDNVLLCDLRDVRKVNGVAQAFVQLSTDKTKNGWIDIPSPNSPGLVVDNAFGLGTNDRFKKENLIKLKVLQIQELQTKLEAKSRLSADFLDSALLIGKALDANRIDFITSQAEGGYWGYDFSDKIEEWTANYDVVIQPYKSAMETPQGQTPVSAAAPSSQKKGILAKIKSFFTQLAWAVDSQHKYVGLDAGTFFFITKAPSEVINEEIAAKNNAIARDAQRYNLFSVLTDLSLENIEGIFRECLAAAFGSADYILGKDQIEKVIKSALESGAAEHLKAALLKKLDQIAQAAVDGAKQGIVDDTTFQFIVKFFNQCHLAGECQSKTAEQVAREVVNGCGASQKEALVNTCCYCVKSLMQNGAPPRFISNSIAKLFTANLGDVLPNVQNILQTRTLDVLFPPDKKIGAFLETPMIDIYDKILRKSLTKPFPEQVPGLDKLLNKQMKDVLPDFISSQIEGINSWLVNAVSTTKSLVKKYSEGFVMALAEEYIEQPIHQWAQNQFDKMGLGTEHLTISGCFDKLEQGYVYRVDNSQINQYNQDLAAGKSPQEPGMCQKMTSDEITDIWLVPEKFIYERPEEFVSPIKKVETFTADFRQRETICRNTGYSWRPCSYKVENATDENDYKPKMPNITETKYCCLDVDDLVQDVQGAVETIQDVDKLKTYVAGGVVNYVEKLGIAFTQTALQFALAYARVFVEDKLIAPFITSWNTITNFQKGMEWFLTASVKEILPDQIANFLQSDFETELKNFCAKYQAKRDEFENRGQLDKDTKIEIDISFNLPTGVAWDGSNEVKQSVEITQEQGDKVCQLKEHLEAKAFEQIVYYSCNAKYSQGTKWQKICNEAAGDLQLPLAKALEKNVCVEIDGKERCLDIGAWFNRTLAGMLFPGLNEQDLLKIIKSTPKDLVCGTVPFVSEPYFQKCKNVFNHKFGFIPQFTTDQAKLDAAKDIMPWCFFINYACQNPLTFPPTSADLTVGKFIKETIETTCALLDSQIAKLPASNACSGKCFCAKGFHNCPSSNIVSNNCNAEKIACKFCNSTASYSVFYTLVYEAVKNEPKTADRQNEKEFYSQMVNDFPELANDIKAVAENRGLLNWQEILDLIPKKEDILKTFVSGNIPNIIKLLVNLGQTGLEVSQPSLREIFQQDAILGRTPAGVIKEIVCPRVVADFDSQYPQYTFEEVQAENLDKIRNALPYTMESVQAFTTAEQIRIVANAPVSNTLLRDSYILCKTLDKTPKEIFGIDQQLNKYIQPPEYRILFDLLQDGLSEGSPADCRKGEVFAKEKGQAMCCDALLGLCYNVGERPASLNQLLEFMSFNDPITALRHLQESMPFSSDPNQGFFPIAFYFNADLSANSQCLKQGTRVSSCSSPVPQVLESYGIGRASVISPSQKDVAVFGETMVIPKEQILGTVQGTDNQGRAAAYYLYQAQDQSDFIFAFQEPNQAKADFANTLNFMETPIWEMISGAMGDKSILDAICQAQEMQAEVNAKQTSVCDLAVAKDLQAKRLKIVEFLAKTPAELLEKYLDKPMLIPDLFKQKNGQAGQASIMDALSANTALGQPFLDTIGRMLGWDDKIFGVAQWADKKAKWVDAGAVKAVEAMQDGLETALVDWPLQAGKSIAGFFGFEVGDKTSKDIAGGCYAKPATGCKANEQPRIKDGKNECCILAKAQACSPRCRIVEEKVQKCNTLAGEMPDPIRISTGKKTCCFRKVGSGDTAKCHKCRQVNFEAGAECRLKDENNKDYEKKENNACCFDEDFKQSQNVPLNDEEKALQEQGMCCTTVSQCIASRLSSHLETLAEMMADGKIPLRSLKER